MDALNRTAHAVVTPGQRVVIPHQPFAVPHQPVVIPDQLFVIPDVIRDPWLAGAETPDPIRGRNDNQGAVANGKRPGHDRKDNQRGAAMASGPVRPVMATVVVNGSRACRLQ